MAEKIKEALLKLDVSNDNHWTADGLPRIDTVKLLSADPSVTREVINEVLPGFTRETAVAHGMMSAMGAAQPASTPEPQAGQGVTGDPHPIGAGAAPQASQAPEGPAEPAAGAADAGDGGDTAADPATDAGDEAEQPEVEDGAGTGDADALAEVEAELEEVQAELVEMRRLQSEAAEGVRILMEREAAVHDKLIALKPSERESNMTAIQAYLASQQRNLEHRAARKELIADSGIDLSQLAKDLKAPIDVAIARANAPGQRRGR
jgi:hypothetical protein